jgi:hypothetical protein
MEPSSSSARSSWATKASSRLNISAANSWSLLIRAADLLLASLEVTLPGGVELQIRGHPMEACKRCPQHGLHLRQVMSEHGVATVSTWAVSPAAGTTGSSSGPEAADLSSSETGSCRALGEPLAASPPARPPLAQPSQALVVGTAAGLVQRPRPGRLPAPQHREESTTTPRPPGEAIIPASTREKPSPPTRYRGSTRSCRPKAAVC